MNKVKQKINIIVLFFISLASAGYSCSKGENDGDGNQSNSTNPPANDESNNFSNGDDISTPISENRPEIKDKFLGVADLILEKKPNDNNVSSAYGSASVMRLLYENSVDVDVKNEIEGIYGGDLLSHPFGFINRNEKDKFEYFSKSYAYIKKFDEGFISNDQFLYSGKLESKDTINKRIEKETGLKNVVEEEVSPDDVALFINILKSKATWVNALGSSSRKKMKLDSFLFSGQDKEKREVPSLEGTFVTKIIDDNGKKFALLPASGKYGIIIGINSDPKSSNFYTAPKITGDVLEKLNKAELKSVKIKIPKYKFNSRLDLKEILSEKMPKTFKTSFKTRLSNGKVQVSKFLQIAEISFDEDGFEAQAATSMVVSKCAVGDEENLIADHPFCFGIIDLEEKDYSFRIKNVYFEGKIVKV